MFSGKDGRKEDRRTIKSPERNLVAKSVVRNNAVKSKEEKNKVNLERHQEEARFEVFLSPPPPPGGLEAS